MAKFSLDPMHLDRSWGFSASELRKVEGLVDTNASEFVEAWHEFFRR